MSAIRIGIGLHGAHERAEARDVVVFRQAYGPASFERPKIGFDRLKRLTGFLVSTMDLNFHGGPVGIDHNFTWIETKGIELREDEAQAFECRLLTLAHSPERVHILWDVDHVGEFVRQVACEPLQVVVSPGIVDIIENGFGFCR